MCMPDMYGPCARACIIDAFCLVGWSLHCDVHVGDSEHIECEAAGLHGPIALCNLCVRHGAVEHSPHHLVSGVIYLGGPRKPFMPLHLVLPFNTLQQQNPDADHFS